ncbi:PAS domain S-box-containing protein [Pedobacter sp. AK017]|uniref:PAS domain S-box protein n=1 Tax=Pedobacter sp. AK017 TaxID=2723073 RepID=UPI00161625E0|nr:PAS domain S-box protein [Pedobacter sp. AK017]MBB5440227.1 PAS domain S-box-containing protein [Pedobacter sp. AK017]
MSFESELIKYKQKIATILESFTDAFFEVDLDWTVTYWNKECERLLDKSKSDIIGKNLWKEFSKAISLKFYTEYHKAMREKVAVRFQEYWPQKKMWVEVSAFPSGEGLSVYFKDITEWKRITRQLEREKKRYYDLFNHSPLPQWVYDFKTLSILQVNDAAIKQYGYSRREFLKMTLIDIRPPEDVSTFTQILDNDILKGRFNSSVVRHRKKNGDVIFVSVDGNSVFFDNKNARLVMAVDQTEQIKAELELGRSEQRFKALVQDGSDLIGILDEQGNYKYVSPTTKQILGIETAHFIGKNAFEFIHPDDRSATLSQFEQLANEKRVKLLPFRFVDGKGKYRWIETVVTNMLDDPAIEGIVSNSRDITDRVEGELKTEQLLNRFNIVAKATSDAIWDWDISTGKIQWNQAIKGVYGYRDTCFDINWWEQQVHPDDIQNVQQQFDRLTQSKQSRLQLEYRFRCADGTYKCVLDRSFVLFNQEGKPTRMIGSMEDITERIAHIKAIEEQNTRLHEIAWIQAHDVRAPLAKIIGLVNLLEGDMNQEALGNIINHLKCSTRDLDQVINRLINKPD